MIMLSAEETTWKFNGKRLGDIMLLLFRANNAHDPVSEAEISGFLMTKPKNDTGPYHGTNVNVEKSKREMKE